MLSPDCWSWFYKEDDMSSPQWQSLEVNKTGLKFELTLWQRYEDDPLEVECQGLKELLVNQADKFHVELSILHLYGMRGSIWNFSKDVKMVRTFIVRTHPSTFVIQMESHGEGPSKMIYRIWDWVTLLSSNSKGSVAWRHYRHYGS